MGSIVMATLGQQMTPPKTARESASEQQWRLMSEHAERFDHIVAGHDNPRALPDNPVTPVRSRRPLLLISQ